ncbi:MAG: hypothetical protein JW757_09505 [Anaerolineales bacterium]|nr:hypothetical protein [Anaerolineales bacterium]
MGLNAYWQQLSSEITIFGIMIVLEIAIFGIWAVIYLRRQANALHRTAEIEERRNSFLIRSRREKLAGEIKIEDGLAWLSEVLGRRLDYALNLVDLPFVTGSPAMAVAITADGKSVLVSPARPNEIKKVFKRRATANGHSMEASDLDAAASIVKGAKAYRAALVDRDTSEIFDLEVKKVGELLKADWDAADELWFYVSASKASAGLN